MKRRDAKLTEGDECTYNIEFPTVLHFIRIDSHGKWQQTYRIIIKPSPYLRPHQLSPIVEIHADGSVVASTRAEVPQRVIIHPNLALVREVIEVRVLLRRGEGLEVSGGE